MTTHTWKTTATGLIYTATNYVDGQAFAVGDTLVVAGGQPDAAGAGGVLTPLTSGTYVFDNTSATSTAFGAEFTNISLNAATTLQESGAGSFHLATFGLFETDGTLEVGTPSATGTMLLSTGVSNDGPGFTNGGRLIVQNHSRLQIDPNNGGPVTNSAGATISVTASSSLAVQYSNELYLAASGLSLVNNGLISIAGQGSSLDVEADDSGSGTLSVTGMSGASPALTTAHLGGAASGTFDVASGVLSFGNATSVQGVINFGDADALVSLRGNVSLGQAEPIGAVPATINGAQAGDQILLNSFAAYGSYAYNQATSTLSVYSGPVDNGSTLAQLVISGTHATANFSLAGVTSAVDGITPGANSVLITLVPTPPGVSTMPGASGTIFTTAYGGSDVVTASASGSDVVNSQGYDTINAGGGSDIVYASGVAATVHGGAGNLTFVAGAGNYAAGGGAGTDILYGGNGGSSVLTGGGGSSSIIVAGLGNTSLVGGAGSAALMFGGSPASEYSNRTTAFNTFTGSAGGNDTMVGGVGGVDATPGTDGNIFNMTSGDIAFGGSLGPDTYNISSGTALVVEGPYSTVNFSGGDATVFQNSLMGVFSIAKGADGTLNIIGFDSTLTLTGGFTAADAANAIANQTNGSFGTALHLSDGTTVTLFGVGSVDSSQVTATH